MAEQQSPLDSLKAFRELLVEERRRIVSTALEIHKNNDGGGPSFGPNVLGIQGQIDAIDRAIEDEERSQPSVYERRGLIGT